MMMMMFREKVLQMSEREGVEEGGGRGVEFFIDNLLVRIHFIIVMIRWTGLAPWEREKVLQMAEREGIKEGVGRGVDVALHL